MDELRFQNIINSNLSFDDSSLVKGMISKAVGIPPANSTIISEEVTKNISEIESYINIDDVKQLAYDLDALNDLSQITPMIQPPKWLNRTEDFPVQIIEGMRSAIGLEKIEGFVTNPAIHHDYKTFFKKNFVKPILKSHLGFGVRVNTDELKSKTNAIVLEELEIKKQFLDGLKEERYKEDEVEVYEFNQTTNRYELSTLSSVYSKMRYGQVRKQGFENGSSDVTGKNNTPTPLLGFLGGGGGGSRIPPPNIRIKIKVTSNVNHPPYNLDASHYSHNKFYHFAGPGPVFNGSLSPGIYTFRARGGKFKKHKDCQSKYKVLKPGSIHVIF